MKNVKLKESLDITPSITVHELLNAYPELEDVLIGIAPTFKKLKNPVLRRSSAKLLPLNTSPQWEVFHLMS